MFQEINHRICQNKKLLDQGEAIKIPMEGCFFLTLAQLCNLISLDLELPFRVYSMPTFIKITPFLNNFVHIFMKVGNDIIFTKIRMTSYFYEVV